MTEIYTTTLMTGLTAGLTCGLILGFVMGCCVSPVKWTTRDKRADNSGKGNVKCWKDLKGFKDVGDGDV